MGGQEPIHGFARGLKRRIRERPLPEGGQPTADESIERELVYLGLVGILDPPRPEAMKAVAEASAAGIRVLMITGDHPATAGVIANELGISEGGRTLSGPEIERMSDGELDAAVRDVSVYARVTPEHKLRIVRALRRAGAIVAMILRRACSG